MGLRLAAFLVGHGRRYDAWHVHIGHHLGAVTCLVGALLGKPVVVKFSGWWELEPGVLRAEARPLDLLARRWLSGPARCRRSAPASRARWRSTGSRPSGSSCCRTPSTPRASGSARAARAGRAVPRRVRGPAGAREGARHPDRRLGAGVRRPRHRRPPRAGRAAGRSRTSCGRRRTRSASAGRSTSSGHRDRVEDVLADADVGVLPSRIEGLSNTLLEFMACGLPPIASRVSGSEDFVEPGAQRLAVPGDVAGARARPCARRRRCRRERLARDRAPGARTTWSAARRSTGSSGS